MKFVFALLLALMTTNLNAFVIYEGIKTWNQDSITFYFSDGTEQQHSEVKKFARMWQRYTGIQFKYSSKSPNRFGFKKHYKISFSGNQNESNQGAIILA